MTGDQPVDDKEDEKGDDEGLYALADHNDGRGVEKLVVTNVASTERMPSNRSAP